MGTSSSLVNCCGVFVIFMAIGLLVATIYTIWVTVEAARETEARESRIERSADLFYHDDNDNGDGFQRQRQNSLNNFIQSRFNRIARSLFEQQQQQQGQ